MRLFDLILQMPFSWRQQRAMLNRSRANREQFVKAVGGTPFADEVADELWRHLRGVAVVEDFRPLPDDDLGKLYGIAEEELDEDLLLALIGRFGLKLPQAYFTKSFGPIARPRDVVRFLDALHAFQTSELGK